MEKEHTSAHVQLTVNENATIPPAPPPRAERDFDDTLTVWLSSPEDGYAAWIQGEEYSDKTKGVYISMWNKFARWLSERRISLDRCEAHHLEAFLDGLGLETEHRQRYVRLVERAYGHLQLLGLQIHNPGSQAARDKVGAGANAPTKFLEHTERAALETQIREALALAAPGKRGVEKKREEKKREERPAAPEASTAVARAAGDCPLGLTVNCTCLQLPDIDLRRDDVDGWATLHARFPNWMQLRDATIAALMLGGGLKVSEVLSLKVDFTITEQGLKIPAAGKNVREHVAFLYPVAREALCTWTTVRKVLPVTGGALFPAAIDRRQTHRDVKTAAMHPATAFRRIQSLLDGADIRGARASGQTLRNTYVAMLIEDRADDERIIESLGIFVGEYSKVTVNRLREAYASWLDESMTEQAHRLHGVAV